MFPLHSTFPPPFPPSASLNYPLFPLLKLINTALWSLLLSVCVWERGGERAIEGGAAGTLRGKKEHSEVERGSGRDSAATYPPGHEPAPRVLGSGGHGLGLIAAGGPRGPRRVPGSPSGQDPRIAAEGGGGSWAHTGPACVTSGSSRGDA